jgi:hypothetical protein
MDNIMRRLLLYMLVVSITRAHPTPILCCGPDYDTIYKYDIGDGDITPFITGLPDGFFPKYISSLDNNRVLISGIIIGQNPDYYDEYSAEYYIDERSLKPLNVEMMVTDVNVDTYLGMHEYERRENLEKHPFFKNRQPLGSDHKIAISTVDPINLHLVEYSDGELKRLTHGYGYNKNPNYFRDNYIIYYSHNGEYGEIKIMDSTGVDKFKIEIDDKYLDKGGIRDLPYWNYTIYENILFITNEHYLFMVSLNTDGNIIEGVLEIVELLKTEDSIIGLTVSEEGLIYLLLVDFKNLDRYVIEYHMDTSRQETVVPPTWLYPPITVLLK